MKVIIMGCGRIGSRVATLLSEQGHDVVVIDHDNNAAGRLSASFKGRLVKGVGFDRDVLKEAGIEQADAFVAASSSDNANIVAARIARNVFRVPRVVTRLYDPLRAEIYERLGLTTISSSAWGAQRIVQVLSHPEVDVIDSFGHGEVSLIRLEAPPNLIGQRAAHLNVPGECMLIAITREDTAFVPVSGTEIQAGDILYLSVLSSSMERLEAMLGMERR